MKRHLTQFAIVLLLPLIVLVGIFFTQLVQEERGRIENQAKNVAEVLTLAIDRELYGLQRAAEIISYTAALRLGRYDEAELPLRELASELKIRIKVYSPEAELLLSSHPSQAADLPVLNKSDLNKAAELSRPYITGIARAHDNAPYYITVVRPVAYGGRFISFVALSMPVRPLSALLEKSVVGNDWIVSVIDQNNTILARNNNIDDHIGNKIREDTTHPFGWKNVALHGENVMLFSNPSLISGWRILVGIDSAELNQPVWSVLKYLVLLLGGTIALTAILAGYFGRRISAPVRILEAQARALGDGQPVSVLNSGIRELDVVSDALKQADDRRAKKEAVLLEAQVRLQMALDAGRVGIWEYDPESDQMTLDNRTAFMLAIHGKRKIAYTTEFLPDVHEDDRARLSERFALILEQGETIRETFRVYDAEHKKFIWLNGIGRRVYNDEGKPSVLGLLVNVTAEQRALEQREVVAQELNHRLKNMFSVIISLMTLSARDKTDINDYVTQMRERMMALSSAFELTYQKGDAAEHDRDIISLNALLARLAGPYSFAGKDRITISGDELPCLVAHVTSFSLVFHELVTNAVKHGALSVPDGRIEICLTKKDSTMIIEWREINGPQGIVAPSRQGFGSRLKKVSIEVQLRGAYQDFWEQGGLVSIIKLPLPEVIPDDTSEIQE